jgi:epoxide hydrolase-like predicted phosphatase
MTIKAIMWDFSGVLLTPKNDLGYNFISQLIGIPVEVLTHYFNGDLNRQVDLGEISSDAFYKSIFREQNLNEDLVSRYYELFSDAFELNHPLINLTRTLRKRLKFGLLSNYSDRLRPMLENEYHIADLFDDMVISCEVHQLKPEERIYRTALDRLDVKPQEAIFVDDRIENIDGANKIGIHAVHYQTSEQVISEINGLLAESN